MVFHAAVIGGLAWSINLARAAKRPPPVVQILPSEVLTVDVEPAELLEPPVESEPEEVLDRLTEQPVERPLEVEPMPKPEVHEPVEAKPDRLMEYAMQRVRAAKVEPPIKEAAAESSAEAKKQPARPAKPARPTKPRTVFVEVTWAKDNPPPTYPKRARRLGHEGKVVVEVRIGADGRLLQAKVVEPCRYAELNRAALAAVQRWRFHAAKLNGFRVEGSTRIDFVFKLED